VTEVEVPSEWPLDKRRIADLHSLGQGDVSVTALIRGGRRQTAPPANPHVQPRDPLLLEGNQHALDPLVSRARLKLTRPDQPAPKDEPSDEIRVVEAVVGPGSALVGQSAARLDLHNEHGLNLVAVSRSGYRLRQTLRSVRFRSGDIVILQ